MSTTQNDPGEQFVKIALSINTYLPGYVSEYWGNKELRKSIDSNPIPKENLLTSIDILRDSAMSITDELRKSYLLAHADAFQVITTELLGEKIPFGQFITTITGTSHEPINEDVILDLKKLIQSFADNHDCKPYELFIAPIVEPQHIVSQFNSKTREIQRTIEDVLRTKIPGSFTINTTKEAAWGAFNHHVAPYTSSIEINDSLKMDELDITYLLIHEVMGGHHTELSLKDRLYIEEKRLEHSLICVFSPQTFISEGIAESACELFDLISSKNEAETLFLYFNQLYSMMQYDLVFRIHEEGWSPEQCHKYLSDGNFFEEKDVDTTIKFLFDPIWGRYGAWYYAAKRLVLKKFNTTPDKQEFLTRIYNLPVTAVTL